MNGTTRRFSEPSDGLDIERLISLAAKAFESRKYGHLSFVYVDEDGDAITATSNTELQEAVAVMTAMNDGKPKLQFKLLQGRHTLMLLLSLSLRHSQRAILILRAKRANLLT